MIRVFNHYISRKAILFFVLETLLLLMAAYVGISFLADVKASNEGFSFTLTFVTFFALCTIFVMAGMGLYQIDAWENARSFFSRFVAALLLVLAMTGLTWYLVPSLNLAPSTLVITAAAGLTIAGLLRVVFYNWSELMTQKRRVLVLGTGSRVTRFVDYTRCNTNLVIVGFVAIGDSRHYVPPSQILAWTPAESLLSLVEKYRINEIVIAVRERRGGSVPVQELLECRLKGITIIEMPTFFEREDRRVMLESLSPSWILLSEGFRRGYWRNGIKRIFDLAVSGMLLLLTLPIMILTALCIAVESGGPILYRQQRVGEGGKVFTIYKFRSMRIDAEGDGTPRWAASNDDRVTVVGRIIRKLRIDELPQIINICRGEMSFVGPRPERPFFVEQLAKQIPYFSLRQSLKPGITGWAQVNYSYGASLDDAVEKLQYDLYYLKNHSLFLDLMILIATVEVVLWGKGAR